MALLEILTGTRIGDCIRGRAGRRDEPAARGPVYHRTSEPIGMVSGSSKAAKTRSAGMLIAVLPEEKNPRMGLADHRAQRTQLASHFGVREFLALEGNAAQITRLQ